MTVVARFPCPYLGGEVELTDERERHIRAEHPDVLLDAYLELARTLSEPTAVYRDPDRQSVRIFRRPFLLKNRRQFTLVVVVASIRNRRWVVTAYVTKRPTRGILEWHAPSP